MPSPRLFSVAALVGLGAVAAAIGGLTGARLPAVQGASNVRAAVLPSPTPTVSPTPLDVAAENRATDGVARGWRISATRGTSGALAAYAADVSVRSGQPVPLMVSGRGPVRVRALRIGWYGGVGARQVWEGSLHARPEPGAPSGWQARTLVDTTGWPEGDYLLRLDQGRASRYVPLTVRSASAQGRILVLSSPLSWQAENSAAGASASGPRTASFDRPYDAGYGAGGFLADDEAIVQLAERSGEPLAYATDYDVATDPTLLTRASAVLVGGDSRFWTASLRTAVRIAADRGTNLAFFGEGTGSRLVTLADHGRAVKLATTAVSSSVRLTGLRPSCGGTSIPIAAGWTVSNAGWWGYRGTGVRTGDVVPELVAGGADRASTGSAGSPASMQVLSFSRIACGPAADAGPSSGGDVSAGQVTDVQSAVYQVRPSKAGVFTAGVGRWACAAAATCVDQDGKPVDVDRRTQAFVVRVTRNVISAFAEPAAGLRYPARNTAATYAALR